MPNSPRNKEHLLVDLSLMHKNIQDVSQKSHKSQNSSAENISIQQKIDNVSRHARMASAEDKRRMLEGKVKMGRRQSQGELDTPKLLQEARYIQRNVITKYAFATRVGYIPNNTSKVNQDSYILTPTVEGPTANYKHFFGVCDGHGSNGHHASGLIKDNLSRLVGARILEAKHGDETDRLTELQYKKILEEAFLECDDQLINNKEGFDVRLSGSTVCTVLFDGTRLHCANSGDSRAIRVKFINDDTRKETQVVTEALSEDHKPELPEEAKRIKAMGGRIDSFHDAQNNNEAVGP